MDSIPSTSGIYKITCTPTGKVYVGSSINLRHRYSDHWIALTQNRHGNVHLQRAWNKYGRESFEFVVLREVAPGDLLEAEQFFMELTRCCHRKLGFNIRKRAVAKPIKVFHQLRLWHGMAGRPSKTPSSEHKSQRTREVWMGRKHKPESIERMRQAKLGKPEHPNAARAKVEASSRDYIVTDPDGNEYVVKNLSEFCRGRGLHATTLIAMARGRKGIKQTKGGWKCRYP